MERNPADKNWPLGRDIPQLGYTISRRKSVFQDTSLVTSKMLETINVNIQNPEHSKVFQAFISSNALIWTTR